MDKLKSSPLFGFFLLIAIGFAIYIMITPDSTERIINFRAVDSSLLDRSDTLRVFTYPNYFKDPLIAEFAQKHRTVVKVEYYYSNEELIDSLLAGNIYDLIVPTDYVVQFLSRNNLIQRIDRQKLSNFRLIDDRFRELDYDYANQFSIPYFWGSVGIVYNQQFVMGLPLSWNDFFDPERSSYLGRSLSILDDMRMTIGVSLISLGYDPNTIVEEEIAEATERLYNIIPQLRMIESEELVAPLVNEQITMGLNWSGSSAKVAPMNTDLRFILPSEGSIFFVDNLSIPSNAINPDMAHRFIDFFLDPVIAARLTNKNFFPNPIINSRRYIDRRILKGPAYKNPFLSRNIHSIRDVGEFDILYQQYWQAFRDSAMSVIEQFEITEPQQSERIRVF
ncbi:MAG: spermidine/putrescine ABC transporter substrate-binding protein [Balneolales bacterium]|nr:spermidine/putrescine ABC transporter substrate-binding protein [Balneolales bacterium]